MYTHTHTYTYIHTQHKHTHYSLHHAEVFSCDYCNTSMIRYYTQLYIPYSSKFLWSETLHFMSFAMKVNFHNKIFTNLPKFHELLVPSKLIPSSISHAFREEIFMNKVFVIQKIIHEIHRPRKFGATLYIYDIIMTSLHSGHNSQGWGWISMPSSVNVIHMLPQGM